jgi:hypothetical protein
VLKLMQESTIKAEVFYPVKKGKTVETIPKLGMNLLQGGENVPKKEDKRITTPSVSYNSKAEADEAPNFVATKATPKPRTTLFHGEENDMSISSLKNLDGAVQTNYNVSNKSIVVSLNEKNGNNILSKAMPMKHTFVGGEFRNNHHNTIDVQKSNLIDTLSKSRTNLIQGRENNDVGTK